MWRVHRLDHISAKKPAKLLDSKSLTLGFSRKQIWPVFLPVADIGRGGYISPDAVVVTGLAYMISGMFPTGLKPGFKLCNDGPAPQWICGNVMGANLYARQSYGLSRQDAAST